VSQSSWDAFVSGQDPSGHGAEIYSDSGELAESVAAFLAAGFAAGGAGLLVATPDHAGAIASALASRGWSAETIESEHLLVVDAETTLEAILVDGVPSAQAFEEVVGGLVDRFAHRPLRIFGEMVDLLTAAGRVDAAIELEELLPPSWAARLKTSKP